MSGDSEDTVSGHPEVMASHRGGWVTTNNAKVSKNNNVVSKTFLKHSSRRCHGLRLNKGLRVQCCPI